eukprot:1126881-Pleurochrysis_carterae.AAC.1
MEVGNALCVRGQSANASSDLRLTPEELVAQDERELAIAECIRPSWRATPCTRKTHGPLMTVTNAKLLNTATATTRTRSLEGSRTIN